MNAHDLGAPDQHVVLNHSLKPLRYLSRPVSALATHFLAVQPIGMRSSPLVPASLGV
jgi:hypothetical protein